MFGENATLTSIQAPAATDGYGEAATAGATLWQGAAPCYLRRRRSRTKSAGESTIVNADEVFIRRVTGAPLDLLRAGDQAIATTITVTDRRATVPVTKTYRVVDVDNRTGGTSVDACRLLLDDVR